MISAFIQIAVVTCLLANSHAAPAGETRAVGPSHQLDEFIDGEIVCTGHQLEDNFEENLAAAASSK